MTIVIWYISGYVFFLVYIMVKYDSQMPIRSDYRIAFFWAIFGPIWIVISLVYSVCSSICYFRNDSR